MTKPFRVLSLDGGGMRGVHGAAYLAALARKAAAADGRDVDLGKGFDLIVGTSTGAILGAALLQGVPMATVVALYRAYGPKIFPLPLNCSLAHLPLQALRPCYLKKGDAVLRAALSATLGNETLSAAYHRRRIAYGATTVDMATQSAQILWTPHRQKTTDYGLVDVCLASTAAPMIRSMAVMPPTGHLCCDGGLWASNPVMVALGEALTMVAGSFRPIEIFCLGLAPTPPEKPKTEPEDPHWGAWQWRLGAEAMCLNLAAQTTGMDGLVRQLAAHFTELGQQVSILRCPLGPLQPTLWQHLDVDDARPETMDVLVQQAEIDVSALDGHPQAAVFDALLKDLPRI